ncbi:MAG: hypothetical protein COB66_04765 [Coxiella sp. (in: Bacteria)]|nr:MAG: hypothetical protein COB66_04765 [Coxiella sp. (in: g-proteobacteria)]
MRPITILEREAVIIFSDLLDMVYEQSRCFEIKRGNDVVARIVPTDPGSSPHDMFVLAPSDAIKRQLEIID